MEKIYTILIFGKDDNVVFNASTLIDFTRTICVSKEFEVDSSMYKAKGNQEKIQNCDIVAFDLTDVSPEDYFKMGYFLGVTSAAQKPIILLIEDTSELPLLSSFTNLDLPNIVTYKNIYDDVEDTHPIDVEAAFEIGEKIEQFLNPPKTEEGKEKLNKVFISYSHADKLFLDRLLIHLKPLEKEKLIDLWVDTRLRPGDIWKSEIEKALEKAGTAILLISPDFLASEFIVNNELPPLLKQAEIKGTKIIPAILQHCRFTRDKNLSQFQAINDPNRPIATLPQDEQDKVFDLISQEIEQLSKNAT